MRLKGLFLFSATIFLNCSLATRVAASDNYPRSCIDGYAVMESARGYSGHGSLGNWSLPKFVIAEREFVQCVHDASDEDDVLYAVSGIIFTDLERAYYFESVARISPLLDVPARDRLRAFTAARQRSLLFLSYANVLIQRANGKYSFSVDNMAKIDSLYEQYKTQHSYIQSLSYSAASRQASTLKMTKTQAPVQKHKSTNAAACAEPNVDASIDGTAVEPDYPDIARLQGATGTAIIDVTVSSTGDVTDAAVNKSSGNPALDRAAITAARLTHYKGEVVNCVPTAGKFTFRADFTGN